MEKIQIDESRALRIDRVEGSPDEPPEIELRLVTYSKYTDTSRAVSIEIPADAKLVASICGAILRQL